MVYAFIAALMMASIEPSTAAVSPSPAPSTSPTPTSTKHTLTLAIPPGWLRAESGQYNEWRSPDGSHFRVAIMPATPEYHGPNAADAVKASFQKMVGYFNPKAQIVVKTISVCNGEQVAYRVDDPIGLGTPGFMIIVPGTDSSGLINYEVLPGGKVDPRILDAINKICWP